MRKAFPLAAALAVVVIHFRLSSCSSNKNRTIIDQQAQRTSEPARIPHVACKVVTNVRRTFTPNNKHCDPVDVDTTGCWGHCESTPFITTIEQETRPRRFIRIATNCNCCVPDMVVHKPVVVNCPRSLTKKIRVESVKQVARCACKRCET